MLEIPSNLKWLEGSSDGRRWFRELPGRIQACADRWSLRLESPYPDSQVSIVFPVVCEDGSHAVLKLQFPHPECEHEAEALRIWNGQGSVRLLAHDPALHALLMERCEPGDHLSRAGADEALDVFLGLLPRLWIKAGKPFSLKEAPAGVSGAYSERSKYEAHPRSAVGWNRTHFFFVEVDGRQPGLSMGMTLAELSEYLVKLGCTDGMNFDGGASATMWVLGQVVNSPCQGEKPVANALIVVRKNGAH